MESSARLSVTTRFKKCQAKIKALCRKDLPPAALNHNLNLNFDKW